jgi:hypothetical protein
MFVRFRAGRRRLALSLVLTKRLNGRVLHEHVATLGSVETPLTIRGRIAFYRGLKDRLDRLMNRIDTAQRKAVVAAIVARIPPPSLDEQRELKLETAKADEQTWSSLRDVNAASGQDHERLSAKAKAAAERAKAAAAEAQALAAEAAERVQRLERGDDVPGGLGKPVDVVNILREAGWTAHINDAKLLAEVGKVLGKDFVIDAVVKYSVKASDRASRRIVRQMAKLIASG